MSDLFSSHLLLSELLALIAQVPDGHVMYQTLQPIDRYKGERDWDREPRGGARRPTSEPVKSRFTCRDRDATAAAQIPIRRRRRGVGDT
jgi:hypothetical protein